MPKVTCPRHPDADDVMVCECIHRSIRDHSPLAGTRRATMQIGEAVLEVTVSRECPKENPCKVDAGTIDITYFERFVPTCRQCLHSLLNSDT
jgi:hypothetical protein